MVIKKVIAEGYKAYQERTEIDFSQGIVLISGKSGTGKSSLLDLISLLLLDKCEGTLESNLNWDSNYFYTELQFEHNNDNYSSILEYEKSDKAKVGKSSRKVIKNNEIIAENSEAKEYLALLFDPITTDAGLFFKQDSRPFIDLTDGDRLTLIKKLEKLNFEEQVSDVETRIKELNDEITEIDKELYSLENKSYDFKPIFDLPFNKEKLNEYEKELNKYMKEKEEVDSLKEKAKSLSNKKTNIEDEIEILTNSLNKEKLSLKQLVESKAVLEEKGIEEEQSLIKNKISELESIAVEDTRVSIKNTFIEEKEKLTNKRVELEKEKEKYPLERLLKFDDSRIETIVSGIAETKSEIKQINEKIELCKLGKCPTCGSTELVNNLSKHEKELDEKENIILELQTLLENIKKEKEEYLQKSKVREENKNKLTLIQNELAVIQEKLENYTDEKLESLLDAEKVRVEKEENYIKENIENQKNKISSLKENFQIKVESVNKEITNSNKTIESLTNSLTRENTNLEEVKKELEAVEILPDTTDLENKLSDYNEKIEDYKKTVTLNLSNKEHNELLTKKQEEDKVTYENTLIKKNNVLTEKLNHESCKSILQKDFPNYIIGKVIKSLEFHMNDFIEQVYRELNVELTFSRTGVPLLYGNGKRKVNAKNGLSGAEKCIVQLAFNNVFNKKNNLETICIDESDSATDEVTSKNLFISLGKMMEHYKQMIIISHNNSMKDFMISNYSAQIISIN